MKKFRKEADKLFMGKKGTKKHQKARDDIDRFYGTEQFETAVKSYLDEYGLPEDWNTHTLPSLRLFRFGEGSSSPPGNEKPL